MIHYLVACSRSVDRISLDLDAGLNAALKAIQLEPDLGQAYLTLGAAYSIKGEFIEAESAYQKVIELTTESIDYFD